MGPRRKQQNDSRPGLIVAFFRGRKNRARAEAAKWQPPGSHCCFLSWRQEWDLRGSNKMAAARVSLLLFVVETGMGPARKQQNGSRWGPIVAFCCGGRNGAWAEAAKWQPPGSHCCFFRGSRNRARAEATKWQLPGSHCCFFSWRQELGLGGSSKMAAARVSLLLFVLEEGMGPARKQQNGSRSGLIVAFYRGRRNGTKAEAAKWQPMGSHCCFLSWRQEWVLRGSNKMAAARVSLLLFFVEERMEPGRRQQNGDCRGLIVAFFRGRKNGIRAEAAKWQPVGPYCCFLLWRQEWGLGGSNKMAAARVSLLLSVVEAGMTHHLRLNDPGNRYDFLKY